MTLLQADQLICRDVTASRGFVRRHCHEIRRAICALLFIFILNTQLGRKHTSLDPSQQSVSFLSVRRPFPRAAGQMNFRGGAMMDDEGKREGEEGEGSTMVMWSRTDIGHAN